MGLTPARHRESWHETLRGTLREHLRAVFGPDRTVRIAGIEIAHADRLADIHATAFARPWKPEDFEAFMIDKAIRLDGLFLGRLKHPAGSVATRCVLDEAGLLSVALAREVRGKGYSRPLLAYHLQNLAHAGIRQVHLEVEEGNIPALALYARLGFAQRGVRVGYYARPDGSRADARSMSIDLA